MVWIFQYEFEVVTQAPEGVKLTFNYVRNDLKADVVFIGGY